MNKNDKEKLKWSLLPWGSLESIVKVLMFYEKEKGVDNWKNIPDAKKRYTDALLRHVIYYSDGKKNDEESGISHLAHAACNILFLLWLDNDSNRIECEVKSCLVINSEKEDTRTEKIPLYSSQGGTEIVEKCPHKVYLGYDRILCQNSFQNVYEYCAIHDVVNFNKCYEKWLTLNGKI